MKTTYELPQGYSEILNVNLQKNKKLAFLVNALALLISVAMAVPMHFYIPITTLFDMSGGAAEYFTRFGVFLAALIAYLFVHELVHGAAMKLYGCRKVRYGFTGLYAYAGCDDYFGKKSYIVIALAPIVLLGAVLAAVNIFVPRAWFWVVYFLQICNISGGAGDLYVTCRFAKMPRDILIKDVGVEMTVYSRTESQAR